LANSVKRVNTSALKIVELAQRSTDELQDHPTQSGT
jgi:hypothetical protein